jgi:NodT family efflux transporter outer membrane factor (OMF) lipoprotein
MRSIKTASLIVFGSLTAACTVGPNYTRPEIDTGHGWTVTPPASAAPTSGERAPRGQPSPGTETATTGTADLEHWWQSFGDPVLSRLIETALAQNLDVRAAGARVAEARALRDAAAGGRYPALGTSGGVTRRRQSENGPLPINLIPGIDRDQTIYEIGFDASWQIDVFGRTRRAVEGADARVAAALDRRHAVELTIVAETARAYFELRGAEHEIDALQAAITASRSSLDLVRRRRAAGDVPEAALAQAEAELAALEAQLPMLQGRERSTVLSIGVLLGDLPESELALLDHPPAGYVALKALPIGERADILRRRPDVAAAERSLAAATADVGVATAELFPKIGIGANGGFQSLESGKLLESASETLGIAPLISWRIFDGGRVRAEIRASKARVEVAALQYEGAVKEALTDAEQALTRYDMGLEALARQQTAVDAARRSYGFANDRYRAGDISLLELLDAERALRSAEEGYARTHTTVATELVGLYKALGGGWQAASGGEIAAAGPP